MQLVENACSERIYPVGRLDRNTTGLLLFTNDGELAKKLVHPKHGVRKIYHVTLDKKLAKHHLAAIAKGITLDDGPAPVDSVSYIEGASHEQVGIEIHIGRNRIVRRIFESFGYQIMHLDRVVFGSLTKKDVKRGSWKSLDKKEVDLLRML
jgi:23S rRNA pseudouridine2605 synthase